MSWFFKGKPDEVIALKSDGTPYTIVDEVEEWRWLENERRKAERNARIQEMKEAIVLAWKEINNK